MTERMTRRERLQATVAGQPTDRVAVSLWRHFPGDDQRPADLAWATLAWQAQWDWDFIKVSPASSFCLVDWGAEDRWVGGDEGNREYTRRPIRHPEDWSTLPVLDPRAGRLADQVRCLDLIGSAAAAGGPDPVPFIQTIFSPLAQARNLAGAEELTKQLRSAPDLVRIGLETITATTLRFIEACKSTGIAGVYYAVQMANYGQLSEAEYRAFGEPYDRRILAAVGDLWFNLVHLHGPHGMFDLVASYPCHALNWHDREAGPSLGEGAQRFPGAVCGGLEHWDDILRGDPDLIRGRIADAIQQTNGRRLIVASGCVAPVNAPFSNLRAVRAAVEPANPK
jgi:uroporphyrinogen decarboxylase